MSQEKEKTDAQHDHSPTSSLMGQLVDARESAQLTQRQVGERLTPEDWRKGQASLARWESGKVTPGADVLERLAEIYNLKWMLVAK